MQVTLKTEILLAFVVEGESCEILLKSLLFFNSMQLD